MVKFSKVRDVKSPCRAHKLDAGVDFFVPEDFETIVLSHGDSVLIPSGIHMKQCDIDMLKFENKSGIATKRGLIIGACIVDNEYQGEMHIHLINVTNNQTTIAPGDKIVQGIFYKPKYREVQEVPFDELFDEVSDRGECGFGSTGTK